MPPDPLPISAFLVKGQVSTCVSLLFKFYVIFQIEEVLNHAALIPVEESERSSAILATEDEMFKALDEVRRLLAIDN